MIIIRLLAQTVALALRQMVTAKVRAALAMLLIAVGSGSLVLVVGASEGFKQRILDEFQSVGANKVWVFPRWPRAAQSRLSWRQVRMSVKEADGILEASPSIQRLTPVLQFGTRAQFRENIKGVQAYGIRPVWHEIEGRSVVTGRPFSALDAAGVLNVCLVNDKAVEELELPGDGVGSYILLDGRRFLVVGVVETVAVMPMFNPEGAQTEVYVPLPTALSLRPDTGVFVIAQTRAPELYEDAKAEITFYMRKARNLRPGAPDTFGVEAIEQYINQIRRVSTLMQVFLGSLALVALVVGGIAIMVIQLVSVTERTREIGLRKAVGARPGVILMQFLVEAVVLCVVGSLVGVLAGGAIVAIIAAVPGSPLPAAQVPGWAIGVALAFCAGVGVLFGMLPALKAARLDPIEALRHD
jgi:putative ABC transport system permease protein